MDFDVAKWKLAKKQGAEVIYEHDGKVSTDLILDVIELMEERMREEPIRLRRNFGQILIEGLQNIYHHSTNNKTAKQIESFLISRKNGSFQLSTANVVCKKHVKDLKNRIDMVNQLSIDEVKSLYKIILNNNEFSEKGGAGLGIIDMAKRSGNKLNYFFHPLNKDDIFFNLDVEIS